MLAHILGTKRRHISKLKLRNLKLLRNSKNNNVRDLYGGINDFKKRYQPRTTIVKDEKGVGGTFGAYGGGERCAQGSSGETRGKEVIGTTQT